MNKNRLGSLLCSLLLVAVGFACSSQSDEADQPQAKSPFTESFCDQIQDLAERTGYTQELIKQAEGSIGSAPTVDSQGAQTTYKWGNEMQGLRIMLTSGGGGIICNYLPE